MAGRVAPRRTSWYFNQCPFPDQHFADTNPQTPRRRPSQSTRCASQAPGSAAAATIPGTAAAAATVDVIVIGGGVGGLATAGRLAKAGLSVTVLEKNSQVSGL